MSPPLLVVRNFCLSSVLNGGGMVKTLLRSWCHVYMGMVIALRPDRLLIVDFFLKSGTGETVFKLPYQARLLCQVQMDSFMI